MTNGRVGKKLFGEETRKRGRSGREWVNGVREKMGWKILGGRKVRSERKDGIGWECSGRVEGRGRSEVIGLETFLGVGEDVGWVKKRERVSSVRRVPGRRPRPKAGRGGGGQKFWI